MDDILAIGEFLIDFTPCGRGPAGQPLFAQNPGGAPANMLAMAARLGASVRLVAKVGEDPFGDALIGAARQCGIRTDHIARTSRAPTTLAFVSLDGRGNRTFTFYRKPGADVLLERSDMPEELLAGCRVLHFSGVSLTDGGCRAVVMEAVERARALGKAVSLDPNYRPFLWESEGEAREHLRRAAALADILKVSDEELRLLTGTGELEEGGRRLLELGPSLVLITCGELGSAAVSRTAFARRGAYPVHVVDTTGAGDAFMGGVLYRLLNEGAGPGGLDRERLEGLLDFGNAAGSLATEKLGAIPAIPSRAEIDALIRENR